MRQKNVDILGQVVKEKGGCNSKGMYAPGYRVGKSDDHAARKQKSRDNEVNEGKREEGELGRDGQ